MIGGASKQPVISYLFHSHIQAHPTASCLHSCLPICPHFSQISVVNFVQLIATSAPWFKANFIVRMRSEYHTALLCLMPHVHNVSGDVLVSMPLSVSWDQVSDLCWPCCAG